MTRSRFHLRRMRTGGASRPRPAAVLLAAILASAPAAGQVLDLGTGDARVDAVDPAARRSVAEVAARLDAAAPRTRIARSRQAATRILLTAEDPVRLLVGVQLEAALAGLDELAAGAGDPAAPEALRTVRDGAAEGRLPLPDALEAALAATAAALEIDRAPPNGGAAAPPMPDEAPDELVDVAEFLPDRIAETRLAAPAPGGRARAPGIVAWAEARGPDRRARLLAAARLVRIARRIERSGWVGERTLGRFLGATEALADDLVAAPEIPASVARRLDRLELASEALARATALRPAANDRRLLREAIDAVPPDGDEASGLDLRGVRILGGVLDRAVERRRFVALPAPADLPPALRPVLGDLEQRGDRIELELFARLPAIVAEPALASEPALYGRLVDQSILLRDFARLHERGARLRRIAEPVPGARLDAAVLEGVAAAVDEALIGLAQPGGRTRADARLRRLERLLDVAAPFPLEARLRAGEVGGRPEAAARGPRIAERLVELRAAALAEWAGGDATVVRTRVERVAVLLELAGAAEALAAAGSAARGGAWMLVPGVWHLPPPTVRRWLEVADGRVRTGLRALEEGTDEALDRRLPAGALDAAPWRLAARLDDPWTGGGTALVRRLLERPATFARPAAARSALDLLEAAARSGAGEDAEASRWLSSAERTAAAALASEEGR